MRRNSVTKKINKLDVLKILAPYRPPLTLSQVNDIADKIVELQIPEAEPEPEKPRPRRRRRRSRSR